MKKSYTKRILVIAFSESIHTVRWLSQITDQSWDIHLFPSIDTGRVHVDLRNVTVHHSVFGNQINVSRTRFKGIFVFSKLLASILRRLMGKILPNYRVLQLKRLIKRLKPDIVHSLEIQAAGYLTLKVKKVFPGKFPLWIVTNWGSDIYLFGRLKEHEPKIREVLNNCDYYSCECYRDVVLASKFGFKGKVLEVFPNTGGFDLDKVSQFRQPGRISDRRNIMLKGYQNWAGRALVGLRALERCADALKGYTIMIYSAAPEVEIAAEIFSLSTGIPTVLIPSCTVHEEILKLHGKARISMGLSISDAISTSLLEAMVMGSFPIQSWTACTDEWINDGQTGLLVPPEDPDLIEVAIRRALNDDELVNQAAELNFELAKKKLDKDYLKSKVIGFYKTVLKK